MNLKGDMRWGLREATAWRIPFGNLRLAPLQPVGGILRDGGTHAKDVDRTPTRGRNRAWGMMGESQGRRRGRVGGRMDG